MMHMQIDWNTDIFEPQLEILKTYAQEGKKLTEIYFGARFPKNFIRKYVLTLISHFFSC